MIPVEHERDWTLVDIVHNLRVYSRTVSLVSDFVTLYACATKIKASPTVCSPLRTFYSFSRYFSTRTLLTHALLSNYVYVSETYDRMNSRYYLCIGFWIRVQDFFRRFINIARQSIVQQLCS